MFIHNFVRTQAQVYNQAVEHYREVIFTPGNTFIDDPSRNPVLYLNFTKPFIPNPVPAKVMGTKGFTQLLGEKEGWTDDYIGQVLTAWEGSSKDQVLIFAVLANSPDGHQAFHMLVSYPFGND